MMTRLTKIRVVVHCWWRLWPMWCCGQLAIFQAPISHATSFPPNTAILMIVNINITINIINASEKTGHSLQQSLKAFIFYCWMKKNSLEHHLFWICCLLPLMPLWLEFDQVVQPCHLSVTGQVATAPSTQLDPSLSSNWSSHCQNCEIKRGQITSCMRRGDCALRFRFMFSSALHEIHRKQ